ncbi:MAG: hypothetical protein U1E92_03745 [Moraxella osloensis]
MIDQPMNMDIHTSRIMAAMELVEKSRLRGALAKIYFMVVGLTCPYFGDRMLNQVRKTNTNAATRV